ncbi:MAG: hypothetical protein NTW99_14865 [Chloroflexi bacterium]|nr:hypothetical protein [Chloroflexota bacterium]
MQLHGIPLRALEQCAEFPFKVTQQLTALFVNRPGVFDFIVKLMEKFTKLFVVHGDVPPYRSRCFILAQKGHVKGGLAWNVAYTGSSTLRQY